MCGTRACKSCSIWNQTWKNFLLFRMRITCIITNSETCQTHLVWRKNQWCWTQCRYHKQNANSPQCRSEKLFIHSWLNFCTLNRIHETAYNVGRVPGTLTFSRPSIRVEEMWHVRLSYRKRTKPHVAMRFFSVSTELNESRRTKVNNIGNSHKLHNKIFERILGTKINKLGNIGSRHCGSWANTPRTKSH